MKYIRESESWIWMFEDELVNNNGRRWTIDKKNKELIHELCKPLDKYWKPCKCGAIIPQEVKLYYLNFLFRS